MIAAGIASGLAGGPTGDWLEPADAQPVSQWLAMPGDLFLAMVPMIVDLLVVASIILGMASSRAMDQLRTTGLRTGLFVPAPRRWRPARASASRSCSCCCARPSTWPAPRCNRSSR